MHRMNRERLEEKIWDCRSEQARARRVSKQGVYGDASENGGAANEVGNAAQCRQSLPASRGEGTQRVPSQVLAKDSIMKDTQNT